MANPMPLTRAESTQADSLLARYPAAESPIDVDELLRRAAPAPLPAASRGPGLGEAVGLGALSGATLGLAPRLAGFGTKIGEEWAAMLGAREGLEPSPTAFAEGRRGYEEREAAAREAHPGAFTAAQLAGGIVPMVALSPVGGAAARAAARGGRVAQFAARAAQPALESGIAGAATAPEGATAGEVLRRGATGAALGTAIAGGGEVARVVTGKALGAVMGGLKQRISNEIAEGGLSATTQVGRKKLKEAAEPIMKEVVSGPDNKAVRAAYLGGAEKGIRDLAPIIDKVGKRNERAYAAFEKGGKGDIDISAYQQFLTKQAKDATEAGHSRLAAGIEKFKSHIDEQAEKTGGRIALTQLRNLTTEAQAVAASVLGSLMESQNSKVARQVSGAVTAAMDDTLMKSAKGSRSLVRAANQIHTNNERMHALLTIKDSLDRRVAKEATGKGLLLRGAESMATPAALGAAAGVASARSPEEALERGIKGAAIGGGLRYGLPAAARAAERRITTAAIRAAQGQLPVSQRAAERFAQAIGRTAILQQTREARENQ